MAERADDVVILDERFWSKTIEVPPPAGYDHLTTPCRIWTARQDENANGMKRGRFWLNGKPVLAHRAACAAKEGVSLDALPPVVLHLCDRHLCCEHVRSGTQVDNMRDCLRKGRLGGIVARRIEAKRLAMQERELRQLDERYRTAIAGD